MSKKEVFKRDVSATDETVDGSRGNSVKVQHEGMGGARSCLVTVIPGVGSAAEDGQRGFQDLHSDLLLQVLSHLPQTELFEILSVCKPWEIAVMEANVLWKK